MIFRTLLTLSIVGLFFAPAFASAASSMAPGATTSSSTDRPNEDDMHAQAEQAVAAHEAQTSNLDPAQAAELLAAISGGKQPAAASLENLTLYLRQNANSPVMTDVNSLMFEDLDASPSPLTNVTSTVGDANTQAGSSSCAAASAVATSAQMGLLAPACPARVRSLGTHTNAGLYFIGCTAVYLASTYFYVDCQYLNLVDYMGAAAMDGLGHTDVVVAHTAYATVQHYRDTYYYSCYYDWMSGRTFCYWYETGFSYWYLEAVDYTLATGMRYEFAVPLAAGTFASLAETDSRSQQNAANARIYAQSTRDNTMAPPATGNGTADDALAAAVAQTPLGTLPGLGELLVASPTPNALGIQTTPDLTVQDQTIKVKPAVPQELAALSDLEGIGPVYGHAAQTYDQLSVHPRSFGIAPGDSTGLSLVWRADVVKAWSGNVLSVRVNTLGTGAADGKRLIPDGCSVLSDGVCQAAKSGSCAAVFAPFVCSNVPATPEAPQVPATLYASAGWYVFGGHDVWTDDVPMTAPTK